MKLRSPGLVADSKILAKGPLDLGPVRGAMAPPSADLAPLVNVGGANLSREFYAEMGYVDTALRALVENPVPEEARVGHWRNNITDSAHYKRHIAYRSYRARFSILHSLTETALGRRWSLSSYRPGAFWTFCVAPTS